MSSWVYNSDVPQFILCHCTLTVSLQCKELTPTVEAQAVCASSIYRMCKWETAGGGKLEDFMCWTCFQLLWAGLTCKQEQDNRYLPLKKTYIKQVTHFYGDPKSQIIWINKLYITMKFWNCSFKLNLGSVCVKIWLSRLPLNTELSFNKLILGSFTASRLYF